MISSSPVQLQKSATNGRHCTKQSHWFQILVPCKNFRVKMKRLFLKIRSCQSFCKKPDRDVFLPCHTKRRRLFWSSWALQQNSVLKVRGIAWMACNKKGKVWWKHHRVQTAAFRKDSDSITVTESGIKIELSFSHLENAFMLMDVTELGSTINLKFLKS